MKPARSAVLALLCALCAGTTNCLALTADMRQRAQACVDRVNLYRRLSGLLPVTLDETISEGCVLHANYLGQNPDLFKPFTLAAHTEDPARPGYTDAGAAAAAASDINYFSGGNGANPGLQCMEFFYNSYYHRTPILASGLQTVGYGDNTGGNGSLHIVLLRFGSYNFNAAPAPILLTPPPGSAGIRTSGGGKEIPAPIPNFGVKNGNPIVAYFSTPDPIAWVSSTVTAQPIGKTTAKVKSLTHQVIAPNKPANPAYEYGSICLITDKAMPSKSLITVTLNYTQAGVSKTVTWSFSTAAKGAFDAIAAAAVEPPQFTSPPTASPNYPAIGAAVQFTCAASDSTAVSFAWDFGDGTTDTSGPTVTHTYASKGTYTVTVTASNANGKSDAESLTVTVR
ncbi:MAG TPA: PKD domain-containing protein [Planctomycetota bacterium]|jgi:hypothetical protein